MTQPPDIDPITDRLLPQSNPPRFTVLKVRISRQLHEQLTIEMARIDTGRSVRRGHNAPYGAWSRTVSTLLEQWLQDRQNREASPYAHPTPDHDHSRSPLP